MYICIYTLGKVRRYKCDYRTYNISICIYIYTAAANVLVGREGERIGARGCFVATAIAIAISIAIANLVLYAIAVTIATTVAVSDVL